MWSTIIDSIRKQSNLGRYVKSLDERTAKQALLAILDFKASGLPQGEEYIKDLLACAKEYEENFPIMR